MAGYRCAERLMWQYRPTPSPISTPPLNTDKTISYNMAMNQVDEYLSKFAAPQKSELERIRKVIKQAAPDAEEVISYGMPGFKYQGKYLAGYNAFKDHLSFFPTAEPVDKLAAKLSAYKLSKGTIQFTLGNPIPAELIKDLVKIRLDNILKA